MRAQKVKGTVMEEVEKRSHEGHPEANQKNEDELRKEIGSMKVRLEDNYKSIYTLEDLEKAKAIIRYEKDDEETAKGWAGYAAGEALKDTGDVVRRVIEADARTAKNCRIWNEYGEGTGDMDVWIEGLAETSDGFIQVGAYLSDIWQTGTKDYMTNMWIERYKRA